jgi:hypothetical protein
MTKSQSKDLLLICVLLSEESIALQAKSQMILLRNRMSSLYGMTKALIASDLRLVKRGESRSPSLREVAELELAPDLRLVDVDLNKSQIILLKSERGCPHSDTAVITNLLW